MTTFPSTMTGKTPEKRKLRREWRKKTNTAYNSAHTLEERKRLVELRKVLKTEEFGLKK